MWVSKAIFAPSLFKHIYLNKKVLTYRLELIMYEGILRMQTAR